MVTNVVTVPVEDQVIVSLERAKEHLRLSSDYTDEDEMIQVYIDAAVQAAENYTNGAVARKDVTIKLDGFESPLALDWFPVLEINAVKYYAAGYEDETEMVAGDDFKLTSLDPKSPRLVFLNDLPNVETRFDAVTVEITIGFDAAEVPKPIISAILLQIGDLYERREDRSETISTAAMSLLRPYKKF